MAERTPGHVEVTLGKVPRGSSAWGDPAGHRNSAREDQDHSESVIMKLALTYSSYLCTKHFGMGGGG